MWYIIVFSTIAYTFFLVFACLFSFFLFVMIILIVRTEDDVSDEHISESAIVEV